LKIIAIKSVTQQQQNIHSFFCSLSDYLDPGMVSRVNTKTKLGAGYDV
jgi:hypothetical protein